MSFTVTSTNVGVNPNATTGVSTTQVPTAGAGSGVANLTVVGAALTKAFAPAAITAGTVSRLTFTITNGAGNPAQANLAFTETLPAGVAIAAVPNTASTCTGGSVNAPGGGATLALSGASFAAGGTTCTVGVDVTSATPGAYNNLPANISGLSPGLSAAGLSATLTVNAAPALTKAFNPASVAPGAVSTLTFTITNGAGNPAQAGLGFTDTLPGAVVVAATPTVQTNCPAGGGFAAPGFTVTAGAGSGTVAVSGAALNAGVASCEVRVNVTAGVVGNYNNNSSNLGALAGGLTAAGANATLSVVGTTLTKAFSPTAVGPGVASTLTFTIANGAGNPAQSGLAFTDTFPTNLVVASPPGAVNACGGAFTPVAGAGSVALSGGSLAAAQASCTVSVNVSSAQVGTYVNAAANLSGAPASMDASGVNATLNVLAAPTATKAFGAASVATGGVTSLTLTFTNANAAPATGLAFTDTFPVAPGAMTIANVTTGNTCGGALTNNLGGAIAAGAAGIRLTGGTIPGSGSCSVTVNVTVPAPGAYANTLGAGTITTTNAGSVSTATSATLNAFAPPTLAKAFVPASIASGGTSALRLARQSGGQPRGADGGFRERPAGNFQYRRGGAGDGGLQADINVTSSTTGARNNVTAAPVATGPVALTGTPAAATLTVLAAPTFAKAFAAPKNVAVGVATTLTFTLTNGNAQALTGATFIDDFPAGVSLANATVGGSCAAGAVQSRATTGATPFGAITAGHISIQAAGYTIPASGSCTIVVNVSSSSAGAKANTSSALTTAAGDHHGGRV
ncbi:MAG: hypothetical protein IPH30_05335 [Betaproteobacteria bacterium]|nr:hypothetical protein [Betaproteobacteria bacterium]